MPKLKSKLGPRNHTNPLIWCASIICAIIAVVVIIAGVVVFIGYLIIKPKVPQVSVAKAQLDTIYFDQVSSLTVQVTVVIKAENDNSKVRATFDKMSFGLSIHGYRISNLMNHEFDVGANQSTEFNYVSQSTPIPLNTEEAEAIGLLLRRGVVDFELKGSTKTRWRVWLLGSVKYELNLDCQLHLPIDRTPIYNPPRCSSRSK